MKIRHPWLIKTIAFVAAKLLRVWLWTVRYRYEVHGQHVHPDDPEIEGRFIYAIWHEALLFPAGRRWKGNMHVLISQHADGELITQVANHLGFNAVRGSTTRGGVPALRGMLEKAKDSHLMVTPDGPRGPRRQVQPGVVYLASRTGLPVVPVGIGYRRAWRARSWDRFAVPYPCTAGIAVAGPVVRVPPDADRDELETYRLRLEEAMLAATAEAENWAGSGNRDQGSDTRLGDS
jgi:lysophospholipid acyltransferase (LPLAT)-like uncharacterized protein